MEFQELALPQLFHAPLNQVRDVLDLRETVRRFQRRLCLRRTQELGIGFHPPASSYSSGCLVAYAETTISRVTFWFSMTVFP
jgi:hypothetical protein